MASPKMARHTISHTRIFFSITCSSIKALELRFDSYETQKCRTLSVLYISFLDEHLNCVH